MGLESAAAAIDFAGLIDKAARNKNGREEFDAASGQLDGIHEYEAVAAERQSSPAVEPNKSAGDGGVIQKIGCQMQRSLDGWRAISI
jgi:hypothetical protein